MRDVMPSVPRSIGPFSRLQGVEGSAHGPVADGVHVYLEPGGIERGSRLLEAVGLKIELSTICADTVQAMTLRSEIGLEQRRRVALDHPVGKHLGAVHFEQRAAGKRFAQMRHVEHGGGHVLRRAFGRHHQTGMHARRELVLPLERLVGR